MFVTFFDRQVFPLFLCVSTFLKERFEFHRVLLLVLLLLSLLILLLSLLLLLLDPLCIELHGLEHVVILITIWGWRNLWNECGGESSRSEGRGSC